ncbi:hypothetical protein [uncultured Desulfosarcina sp.]|uniref:hypothetical protein n=1 Tax=uncultured Desulfosarcina sp. TaxID=218289 RepID=UPI0029C64B0A|nr:hypothetical protein [uncultured Desulfosarcina sp.]
MVSEVGLFTRWELTPEGKFEDFLRELHEFLKNKLVLIKRPGITPLWSCVNAGYGHFDRLDNLKALCEQHHYNWKEVKMMIDEYYGCDCHCDCHILQAVEIVGIQQERRFFGGSWRHETFPDDCYEILSKPGESP